MEFLRDMNSTLKSIVSFLFQLIIILLLTFLIIHFVGQRTAVIGTSMVPTLADGDQLIVDKLTYRFSDPERFDIIVFPYRYETKTHFVKRIIGLPGERIRIDEKGNIYINGEVLDESYGYETIKDPGRAYFEIELGPDEYFVLGDNRNNSADSRTEAVNNIHRDEITGRVFLRIYPFSEFGLMKGK